MATRQGYKARKDEQLSAKYGKKKMPLEKRRKIALATIKRKGTYGIRSKKRV
jgi:hypothetical protein